MKKLISWFRSSLEGNDGKSSSKMLTLLWLTVLVTVLHIVFIIIAFRIVEKTVPTQASLEVMDRLRDLIAVDWVILLILFGVATVASVVQLFRAIRGHTITEEETIKTNKTVVESNYKENEETNSRKSTDNSDTANG